jgi:hypothetical protein
MFAVFSAASGCKKAYDAVRDASSVPEQARHLLRLAEGSQAPLRLALRLRNRAATHGTVATAAQLLQDALLQCDDILAGFDELDADEGEAVEAWWKAVPRRAKDNVSRLASIPKAADALTQAMQVLQLALVTVQLDVAPACHRGLQPMEVGDDAAATAADIVRLFDMGRLDGAGEVYPLCVGEVSKDGNLLGATGVVLHRTGDTPSATYSLQFVDPSGEDDIPSPGRGRKSVGPASTEPVRLRGEVALGAGVLAGAGKLACVVDQAKQQIRVAVGGYDLRFEALSEPSLVCGFPAGVQYHDVTAEVFGAVVVLAAEVVRAGATQLGDLRDDPLALVAKAFP